MNDRVPPLWRRLVNAVLEGTATDAERAEWSGILAESEEARQLYLRYVNLHCTLRLISGSMAQPGEKVAVPPHATTMHRDKPKPAVSRRWTVLIAGTAVAAFLVIWGYVASLSDKNSSVKDPIADAKKAKRNQVTMRVLEVHGKLEAVGVDKVLRSLAVGDEISAGAVLRSSDENALSIVELAGDRVHVGPETLLRWMESKQESPQIFVEQGAVWVEPVAMKGQTTIRLLTPHAEVKSSQSGTDIAVSAKATRVAVNEGTIQLTRRSDQKSINVGEGMWVSTGVELDPMVPRRPVSQEPEVVFKQRVDQVAIAKDGKTLALFTGSSLEIWDLETRQRVRVLESPRRRVTSLTFSPDGEKLIVADRLPFLQIWDWRNGRLLHTVENSPLDEDATKPVFSPDGEKLYCLRQANIIRGVRGFKISDWSSLPVPSADSRVRALAAVPMTDFLLAAAPDGILIWDTAKDATETLLRHDKTSVRHLAVSRDGHRLAHTSNDGATIWNLQNRKIESQFVGTGFSCFSPDGKRLVVASFGYVDVWDLATEQLVSTFRTDRDQMHWLHVSDDGNTLYGFSGAKHRIQSWKLPTGSNDV